MKETTSCHSCGAKLPISATQCDLCGTEVGAAVFVEEGAPLETEGPQLAPVAEASPSFEPITCGTCGHVNPAQSKFCNQCGVFQGNGSVKHATPVDVQPETSEVGSERPPSPEGTQALKLIGIAFVVVVALWGVTQLSDRGDSEPAATPSVDTNGQQVGAVIPDSVDALIRSLESENTASAWGELGTVYLSLAFTASSDEQRIEQAQRAVDAFDISLGMEENPDVRTALAEAAQFDPRNPMRAVQELQAVLESVPNHITANYLMGSLRTRIGRLDAAAESFQRVLDLTEPTDQISIQAAQELAAVQQQLAAQGRATE